MATRLAITRETLRDIAAAEVAAKGSWAKLDYSPLVEVGAMADYTDDVFGIVAAKLPLASLDPANDTDDTRTARAKARKYASSQITRAARTAWQNDKARVALLWATIPAPTNDDKDATKRALLLERIG